MLFQRKIIIIFKSMNVLCNTNNDIKQEGIQPLIKWAGGKRGLLSIYKYFFPKSFNTYHEPFLGSGAVFFFLKPKKAVLIDKNEDLINFYTVVRDKPFELMESMKKHKVDKEYYYKIRSKKPKDPVERASWFLYLNKTAYNGLWRVNSKGEFNVPFGRYKKVTFFNKDNLLKASELLRKATILCGDFSLVLEYAKVGDFVYFDPPYFPISETAKFTHYTSENFTKDDHIRLSKVFKELDRKGVLLMLSNSDTEFIRNLYSGYNIREVIANRYINCKGDKRKGIKELVITNY